MLINKFTPQRLFKYKAINRNIIKRDINFIKDNKIWASSINNLNDPNEARCSIDELTKSMWSIRKLPAYVKEYLEIEFIDNKDFIDSLKTMVDNQLNKNKIRGIYSLSKNGYNELMWAHYGASHKGYCLEYEFENNFNSDVNYIEDYFSNKFYEIKYLDKLFDLNMIKKELNVLKGIWSILFNYSEYNYQFSLIDILPLICKSKSWNYEEEVRILFPTEGQYLYHPSCMKSVTFGYRMNHHDINYFLKELAGQKVDFYKLIPDNNTYNFKRVPIN